MTDLEGNMLNAFKEKPMISWRYIDNIFFIWEHGEESMEKFLNKLSSFHPTIKFTAEYSKETINFLDVNIRLVGSRASTHADTYRYTSVFRSKLFSSLSLQERNTV